jgi:hypothetical protein
MKPASTFVSVVYNLIYMALCQNALYFLIDLYLLIKGTRYKL